MGAKRLVYVIRSVKTEYKVEVNLIFAYLSATLNIRGAVCVPTHHASLDNEYCVCFQED